MWVSRQFIFADVWLALQIKGYFCRSMVLSASVPCRSNCRAPERTILSISSTLVYSYFPVSVVNTELKQSQRNRVRSYFMVIYF